MRDNFWPIAGIVAVATFVVVMIGVGVSSYSHTQTYSNCVVNDKDRTRDSDGKSNMRVYTDNCGVFVVKDSLADGTWSSADTFNKIKVGQTYTFDTRGKRIPLFSSFPNIIVVK